MSASGSASRPAPAPLRILNVEPRGYSAEARAVLAAQGELVERELSRAELLAALADFDVLIVRLGQRVDRELLEAGPRLLAVVSATTGLDHVDESAARERGVAVLSLRGEVEFLRGVSATAEHAFALLLALERKIVPAAASVAAGRWERDPFRGRELRGRRLGIVGLGRLGRQVARFGLAFGMRVGAQDPYAREWLDGVERYPTLDALLAESDVLTLHVPLCEETRGLIGRRELARLPAGAVLVNTSRGEVVDEEALVVALQSGRLAGAALDVVQHERSPALRHGGTLLSYAKLHENCLVTPHIGGATHESMAATELFMARKLAAFIQSRQDPEVERCARSAS